MNKRIKELERQATETVKCGLNGTSTTESFNRKKFAELIVKKCANIVWDEAEKTMSSEVNDAGYKIIEYFGVVEREQ